MKLVSGIILLALSSVISASPVKKVSKRKYNVLQARQSDSQCSTDQSCSNASSGFETCVNSAGTDSDFLSCFCSSYGNDLFTCVNDGCSFGPSEDSADEDLSLDEYVNNACALYLNGDETDAEACLESQDPSSASCQATPNANNSPSTVPDSVSTTPLPQPTPISSPSVNTPALTSTSRSVISTGTSGKKSNDAAKMGGQTGLLLLTTGALAAAFVL